MTNSSVKTKTDAKPQCGLKYRMRTLAEQSSIKCLPKMIHASSALHRVLWVTSFVIGTSVAVYLLFGLWSLYFSYSVTLSVSNEDGIRPPFPDVTVCNLNPLWNSKPGWGLHAEVDGKSGSLTYDKYIRMLFGDLYSVDNGHDSFLVSDPELYSTSAFLKHVKYDDVMLAELGRKLIWKCVWESDNTQRECVIRSAVTPSNGLCFTLRPPADAGQEVSTRLAGLSVLLFLNNTDKLFVADFRMSPFRRYTEGVKVVLHPRGTAPNMAEGFTVGPGKEASVIASFTKRELLPQPYGSCLRDMRLDIFDNTKAGTVWNYTEYACTSLCYQSKIIKECGCLDSTEVTFDDLTQKHRFCSIYSALKPQKAKSDINCTRKVKAELDAQETCIRECPPSCSHDKYENTVNQVTWPHEIYLLGFYSAYLSENPPLDDFKHSYQVADELRKAGDLSESWEIVRSTNLIQRNFLQLSITMDDIISTGSDKPAITVEGIIGNLGGILNLWIGFTFITIMEFVDFFLTVVMDRYWAPKPEDETNQSKRKKSKDPDVTIVEPVDSSIVGRI